jgi:hypothetical protein
MQTMQRLHGAKRTIGRLFFESLLDWTSVEGWGHYQLLDDRFLLYDNELCPVVMMIIEPSTVVLSSDHEKAFCRSLEAWDVHFGVSTNLRTFNLYQRNVRDGVRKVASIDLMGVRESSRLTPQEHDEILQVRKLARARFMKIEDVTKYC